MTGKIIDRRVVPNKFEIYENDTNVKQITFSVAKINDGVDLTELYAFINLENENFDTNKVLLTKTVLENEISLVFNIDSAISVEDGITKAQISFESSDLSLIYSTAIFYVEVKTSINGYSNANVSAKSLYDLQSNLTKTLDSFNEKIKQALEEAKASMKFAELNIDGVIYDGSESREIKHVGPKANEVTNTVYSNYSGQTNDIKVYGDYNYENIDKVFGDGITTCVVKGVGEKIEDVNDANYGKYLVRIKNSNGNYYDPLSLDSITMTGITIKPLVEGALYVRVDKSVKATIEIPLKQNFKRNTYYNFRLKYQSGSKSNESLGVTFALSLFNKTTLEEKKIEIQHSCQENVPFLNDTGKNFYSGEQGEICIKVYINTSIGFLNQIGLSLNVVIEEADNPCDGFPLREVMCTDIYLDEPLYKLENIDENTGKVIDALYDELDLKNSRVIRRVRKAIARADDMSYDFDAEPAQQMYIYAPNLYGEKPDRYDTKHSAFRPTIKIKSPLMKDVHESIYFETYNGDLCFFSMQTFSELFSDYSFQFAFFYPLYRPLVEKITPTTVAYRKGLNCFEIEGDYLTQKFEINL